MTFADDAVLREKLALAFAPEQIGKLPKPTNKDNPKGRCKECGGWHGLPAIHVDFVAHPQVTDRLNRYAAGWTYRIDETFVHGGTFWIRGTMTVGGVSRPEYGDGKDPKQAVGNFIRRGAMRFGVALEMWAKQELENLEDSDPALGPAGDPTGSPPSVSDGSVGGEPTTSGGGQSPSDQPSSEATSGVEAQGKSGQGDAQLRRPAAAPEATSASEPEGSSGTEDTTEGAGASVAEGENLVSPVGEEHPAPAPPVDPKAAVSEPTLLELIKVHGTPSKVVLAARRKGLGIYKPDELGNLSEGEALGLIAEREAVSA